MNFKIARAGKVIGDYPIAVLRLKLGQKTVLPTDHYWAEGMSGWELVSTRRSWDDDIPPIPVSVSTSRTNVYTPQRNKAAARGIPLVIKIILGLFGGVMAIGIIAAILFPGVQHALRGVVHEGDYDRSISIITSNLAQSPTARFPDFNTEKSEIQIRKINDGPTSLIIVDSWVSILESDGRRGQMKWSLAYIDSIHDADGEVVFMRLGSSVIKGSEEDRDDMIQIAEQSQIDELARAASNFNRRRR